MVHVRQVSCADRLRTELRGHHRSLQALREGDLTTGLVARVRMPVAVGDGKRKGAKRAKNGDSDDAGDMLCVVAVD